MKLLGPVLVLSTIVVLQPAISWGAEAGEGFNPGEVSGTDCQSGSTPELDTCARDNSPAKEKTGVTDEATDINGPRMKDLDLKSVLPISSSVELPDDI